MSSGIKFTTTEMKHIALFESITHTTVKDCIIDDENGRIIFVVKQGELGAAIGRRGRNIRLLERLTGKKHEVIEHSDDPVQFIKNVLRPARVKEVRLTQRSDGKSIAVVTVDPRDKGIAIGKNGKNAERLRFLVRRYFQIQNVSIL
ncbi:NusA-like transcription termination signal-binding factor [Candidatus Bathyarchaeota archaeon]|nr:NusA-like transcription termination signal-binding factor [Candidatus Bathyarchaeota archaeon]